MKPGQERQSIATSEKPPSIQQTTLHQSVHKEE